MKPTTKARTMWANDLDLREAKTFRVFDRQRLEERTAATERVLILRATTHVKMVPIRDVVPILLKVLRAGSKTNGQAEACCAVQDLLERIDPKVAKTWYKPAYK